MDIGIIGLAADFTLFLTTMKRYDKILRSVNKMRYLMIAAILIGGLGFYEYNGGKETKKDKVILSLVHQVLSSMHFAPQSMDDAFSEKVYTNFISDIDFNKRFLLAEDITSLEPHRSDIDNQIKASDLAFFEQTYVLYQERFEEVRSYYQDILAEPFDFTKEEQIELDDEQVSHAANREALRERWRKYLKYRTLVRLEEKVNAQKEAADTVETKSFESLEAAAREKVLEAHEQWFSNLSEMERIDWIAAYMNTITNLYDPHTQYFPPERKEDFEISMTGQLEGIGAQLQQKGEFVTITKVITGSACWKQGDLEVGDKILQVAQGDAEEDEEPVDMIGMQVRKAVKYIRGPKGTTVILTVRKLDGTKMVIPIVRDVVELESTFAKSAVLGEGQEKMGYIRLPKFYVNFYDDQNRNCADDVKKELEKLKSEGVKGVILDLRNNGGGSLQGVIDIVGLFIEEGPVVQVKSPGKAPRVLKDTDDEVVYDGPLVVMVNRFSASASEIFAAAIQDYHRGVIVGSASTFGKGTVQNVLDMDRAVSLAYNDVKPLGALKLTIQKYYRINGGTPQLRGVRPDVVLPDNYMHIPFGEKEQDYALPYDEIGSANYKPWPKGTGSFAALQERSAHRIEQEPHFNLIREYAEWIEKEQENSVESLHFEQYRAAQEHYRSEAKRFKEMQESDISIVVSSNKADLESVNANEESKTKTENWHQALSTDLILQEAMAVLDDLEATY